MENGDAMRRPHAETGATMPALALAGKGGLELAPRPVPALAEPDDVLIRVVATGICGTDRGIVLGHFPALPGVILGHEAVGEVAAAGPAVTSLRLGQRVVVNPTFWCGRCGPCRRGAMAYCLAKEGREVGVDRDGSMAGYLVLGERFVHAIPDAMGWRRALMVEPLACVLTNLDAAGLGWHRRVLVLGGGPIGSLCALVLAARGTPVTVAERDPRRAALARDILGRRVTVVAHAAEAAPPEIVIDAVGSLVEEALRVVATAGTIVVMGEQEGAVASVPLRALATRGLRLVGAGPYAPATFELALAMAADLPLERLITHVLPLERHAEAFGLLDVAPGPGLPGPGYGAMKVLLASDGQAAL